MFRRAIFSVARNIYNNILLFVKKKTAAGSGSVCVANAHTEPTGAWSPGAVQGRFLFCRPTSHIPHHETVSGMQYGRSPGPMNRIALLKREEEEATLGTPLARGKLTHYPAALTPAD
jgi:hypothetical protein